MVMRTWDKMLRESVKRTPKQERNMTANFTIDEKDMIMKDMQNLTKSYYEALTKIKELNETIQELKNEIESLKGDKVELRSIRGH